MPTATQPAQGHLDAAADADSEIVLAEREHRTNIERLKARRRRHWMRANRAGMTYVEIRDATGYSDGLVCREIARAVREAGASAGRAPGRRKSNGN